MADDDQTLLKGSPESNGDLVFFGPPCDAACPCFKTPQPPPQPNLLQRLSLLDRFLTLWILLTMAAGLLTGYFAPSVGESLQSVMLGSVSLPVALGLVLMLLPVFCKVPYELLAGVLRTRELKRQLAVSFALNWLVGPLLMTGFAWATLPDLPQYRNGVILVGLARCIAMVLLWNSLANGSQEYCAILVALNSCFQLLLYSPLAVLFIDVLSGGGGASSEGKLGHFFWEVTQSVLIFLGIPFLLGILIRYGLIWAKGKAWFEATFVPRFSPLALLGLLYTVFILFASQGHAILQDVVPVVRVAVPLVLYFSSMFFVTLLVAYLLRFPYDLAVTQAFTASSNNFELAIAIAVATFGVTSPEALAATVGPLMEVPVLLGLVRVALWMQPWWERKIPPSGYEGLRSPAENQLEMGLSPTSRP